MVGKKDWLKFRYYAPAEGESKYSGAHRAILLAAIMRNAREITGSPNSAWAVDTAKGIYKKVRDNIQTSTGKQKEVILAKHFVTSNPQRVVDLLNHATKGNWTVEDLNQPFEKLWIKTKSVFSKEVLDKIKAYVETGTANIKKEQPVMELLNKMQFELNEQVELSKKDVLDMIETEFSQFQPKIQSNKKLKGDIRVSISHKPGITTNFLRKFLFNHKIKASIDFFPPGEGEAKSHSYNTFKISNENLTIYVVDRMKEEGQKTSAKSLTPKSFGLSGVVKSPAELYAYVRNQAPSVVNDLSVVKYLIFLMDAVKKFNQKFSRTRDIVDKQFEVIKNFEKEQSFNIMAADKRNIFNDFGEILSAYFVGNLLDKEISFPDASNEPLIDFKIGGESFSAKSAKGAAASISGILKNKNIGKITSETSEKEFIKILNIIEDNSSLVGNLILCKKKDPEAWKALTDLVGDVNLNQGSSAVKSKLNNFLTKIQNSGRLEKTLTAFYSKIGNSADLSKFPEPGQSTESNKFGYIVSPLAYRLVDTLNYDDKLMSAFKSVINKLYLKQIHIFSENGKSFIRFDIKQFKTADPHFDLGHLSAPSPTKSKISFRI